MIDGSQGTVRQLMRILEEKGALADRETDECQSWETYKNDISVRYFESGREILDADRLNMFKKLHERLEKMRCL